MSKLQAATPISASAAGVLHQARVVDLTQVIAGPYCAMQLALLGAQVLRVEAPGGDPLRWRGGSEPELAQRGLSTHYQAHAAGRERLALLDWNTPEGQAQLHAELSQSDVFVCNLRSHVLARTGLDPQALHQQFPRLIICHITGYSAQSDTSADWPAYDNTVQAASGLMRLTGPAPAGARVGAPVLDYATGMAALSAILAALMERQHSGRGQVVQVNMLAVAHELMTAQRTDLQLTGREPVHRGNAANSGEPLSSVFETADGHLALAINEEHQFAKLAQALGHADWPSDNRFADRRLRRQHADALRTLVQQALMTRAALQWERLLCEAGVAAAAVRTLAQALHHPGAEPSQGQGLFHLQRGRLPFAQLHPAHAYSTDPS